ncbi:protein MKS1-like [Chenopodium quinoa]|uniref:protein MKS1-like n=1 Tax=Chenopodium quinoa TaxID=63459 RepID=UPI000B76C37F|nr:protein MKS1-like [Chenopodium quinoa]
MNPPPQPPPKKARRENQIQIQGPRPSPLRIHNNSQKIKKPPIVPKPASQAPDPVTGNQPVIIYSVSPKLIFVEASNFRSIVQHLTGRESTASETTFPGEVPVSPAARFAAIERSSPSERERRERRGENDNDMMKMMMGGERNDGVETLDMGQFPGILSPAPGNLPGISAAMFSPIAAAENQAWFGVNELLMSPFMSNMSFMPSPSALFLSNAPIVSPSPSSFGELFNNFD